MNKKYINLNKMFKKVFFFIYSFKGILQDTLFIK